MNKYFVFALLALCASSASAGRIVRDAAATTPSPLATLFTGFEDAWGKLHTSFLDLVGVKDNTELVNLVDTQSRTYATKLQGIVEQMSEEAKKNSGALDSIVAPVKAKMGELIQQLETKNPELAKDTKKYQEQFEGQMRSVLAEAEKFRERVKGEGGEVYGKLGDVAKNLYETTVTTATSFSKQVENTLKETKN